MNDDPASAGALAVRCAGDSVWLLPERALWWPARRTLFVADLHLGKAAAYRALGQPVPSGTTRENLTRLTRLLRQYQPVELVFLGDFLHAPEARTPSVLGAFAQWKAGFAALHCTLVRGNHDRRAGDPPASLGIEVVNEPWPMGPFAACHHPQRVPGHLALAGHLHPVVRLHGRAREHLRLPCFVLDAEQLVLPAFGEFTGGWVVEAGLERQIFAAGGGSVWRLPGA